MMVHVGVASRARRRATKTVVHTVADEQEPEFYNVCSDVFDMVGKMIATNQLTASFGNGPRFEYDAVRLLLMLLGAPRAFTMEGDPSPVDLWISEE